MEDLKHRTHTSEMVAKLMRDFNAQGANALIEAIADLYKQLGDKDDEIRRLKLNLEALNIDIVNEALTDQLFAGNVRIDALTAHSVKSGLLALEYTADKIPFRWTGGTTNLVEFHLLVDRLGSRELEIIFLNSGPLTQSGPPHISCFVDKQPLEMRASVDGKYLKYTTPLTILSANVPTHIALDIPTWRPMDLDPNASDPRELGLAFKSIAVG